MEHRIENLVTAFHGYTYEMSGMIAAFFDDPHEARECARKIVDEWKKTVQLAGTSLVIYL